MKTAFFTIASIILGAAVFVQADNCNTGVSYCGHSLISKGNYRAQLDQSTYDALGVIVSNSVGDVWNEYLFNCEGGRSGVVSLAEVCPNDSCQDNGNGQNDYCT